MDVVKFLYRYQNIINKINSKKKYIEFCEVQSRAISSPSYGDEVIHSPNRNLEAPFVKWVHKQIDAERELKELEDEVLKVKSEIEDVISSINDHELEMLLIYKYIDNLSWRQIGEKLYFSIATVRRKHELALSLIEFKMSRVEQG